MPGLLNNAIAWLPGALANAKSVPGGVTLSRHRHSTSAVPAIRAWHGDQTVVQDGMPTNFRPYDYLIAADAYVIDGAAALPTPGDRIIEPLGVFEVLPLDAEACYQLREDGLYRIHTRRVSQ